ncbi:acetyltransferase [Kitasatospora sp. MAP5-34]|uniref:acetyltransferase n=1 Tax=Kitasatospora sp. MAP5-34 TaxID=3035102 RepID=UPI002473D4E3|nr:acetyltransferase [Kitasatospora sp. MAP5-34]MDH6576153.1 sugar O-acyltransferase (sialic acid O-acetyltransferase NeuD family) [Kitasatospora sp. MAP5-34]
MRHPVTRRARRQDLVIVGAGGFGRETAEAARAAGAGWRLRGFLDDNPALHGTEVDGVPVLGPAEAVHDLPRAKVVLCTVNPRVYTSRSELADRLRLPDDRYATVVHPTAQIARHAELGHGTVLLAQVVVTARAEIGAHVAVMPQTVLTHDTEVGDFATLASGVRLGGGVRLARGCYLGAGALVREYTTVGQWSLVGMGSVVLHDVPPQEVWAGTPARFLRAAAGAVGRVHAPAPLP